VEIPKSVKIGYKDYGVDVISLKDSDFRGMIKHKEGRILIASEIKTGLEQVEIMLHEITHGIFVRYGVDEAASSGWTTEYIVTVMGEAMTAVFRDNPKLVEWIQENAKP